MKIEGPGKAGEIAKKKKADGASATGDGRFKTMVSGDAGGAAGASGASATSSLAAVDALLMAQAAEDPAQQKARKRMRERADDILDCLNDLKLAMLSGSVTVGHMVAIADIAATHREKITDPDLAAILDEVDLRAQIELAKLRISRDRLL